MAASSIAVNSRGNMTEEELDPLCNSVHLDLFRMGILLRVDIGTLEEIVSSGEDSFVKCRRLIEKWRLNNISPENER